MGWKTIKVNLMIDLVEVEKLLGEFCFVLVRAALEVGVRVGPLDARDLPNEVKFALVRSAHVRTPPSSATKTTAAPSLSRRLHGRNMRANGERSRHLANKIYICLCGSRPSGNTTLYCI